MSNPSYEPPRGGGVLTCPKCRGEMRTYERNGIHLEQCGSCRGIFLDFGELESLTQMEARLSQPPAPAPPPAQPYPAQPYPAQPYPAQYGHGPAWGQHGGHRYHRGGFGRLFFSS
jgi:Zn-finger nucleic acid-binding protein